MAAAWLLRRAPLAARRPPLLIHANVRELVVVITASALLFSTNGAGDGGKVFHQNHSCLMSDFGWHVAAAVVGEPHAANQFMYEWFMSCPLSGAESGGSPASVKEDGNANPN
jgi:hypothetical protein